LAVQLAAAFDAAAPTGSVYTRARCFGGEIRCKPLRLVPLRQKSKLTGRGCAWCPMRTWRLGGS